MARTGVLFSIRGESNRSYPQGRATAMCDGSGATSWSHEQMGRTRQELRKIGAGNGNTQYTYNLDGSLWVLATPPQKGIFYTFTGAGRVISAEDTADGINFVTSAKYAPFGGLTSAHYGAGSIQITDSYNKRLQPSTLSASASATVMSLSYNFGLGTNNNGSVYQITNNRDGNRTQNFLYDSLNRIQQASTTGTNWGETFGIDAWGNLNNRGPVSGKTAYEGLSVSATNQNRLSGFGYDAAGNMTSNTPNTYIYNAENQLIWTNSSPSYRYVYDGHGNRVEKCQAATATTACPTSGTTGTLYWHNLGGDTLYESDLAGNPEEEYIFFNGNRMARRDVTSSGGTIAMHYYFSDHLGTHSIVTDANGTMPPQSESDFYPYGGEIPVVTGDMNHYKFTGKERDSESGLDYFGARHDASSLGRFMSPDAGAFHFNNPQSFNRYVHALNNPLRFVDPDGNDPIDGQLLDHLKHFDEWASPLAWQMMQSIESDSQQGRPMVVDSKTKQYLQGSNGIALYYHIMDELQDSVISQLTAWANRPSTTEGEIDKVRGDIDGTQGARKSETASKGIEEYGGKTEFIVGLINEVAGRAVGAFEFIVGGALESGYQKHVTVLADDVLQKAKEQKGETGATSKKDVKCGKQTDNPSGQTDPLTSTQPCTR